jgi:formylmethanofuran dehydrogenase subunit C
MPKIQPKNVPYTKAEINEILSLKGWLDSEIDCFNLFAVLTIGVTNNTCGPGDSWEIKQKTYSEKPLAIKLEDFADCTCKADVKKRFRQVMQKAVSAAMFPGEKIF